MAVVLVIEDDEVTLETSTLLLRAAGYEVATAASGREGLARLRAGGCDMVLADLALGDMSAIDLLDRMHEDGIDVPVVVITGLGSIELAVKAMRRGAVDFAEKPLIGDDLIEKVELGLAHAKARSEPDTQHSHAAERWAGAVVALLRSRVDVRTTGQWARAINVSSSTLRTWCQRAGVGTRESLVLARLLRAVHLSRQRPWRPAQRLSVTDSRTLAKMLKAAGLPLEADRVRIRELLASQSLISDPDAIAALRTALLSIESTSTSE